LEIERTVFQSDPGEIFGWLKTDPQVDCLHVPNRVGKYSERIKEDDWFWFPRKENMIGDGVKWDFVLEVASSSFASTVNLSTIESGFPVEECRDAKEGTPQVIGYPQKFTPQRGIIQVSKISAWEKSLGESLEVLRYGSMPKGRIKNSSVTAMENVSRDEANDASGIAKCLSGNDMKPLKSIVERGCGDGLDVEKCGLHFRRRLPALKIEIFHSFIAEAKKTSNCSSLDNPSTKDTGKTKFGISVIKSFSAGSVCPEVTDLEKGWKFMHKPWRTRKRGLELSGKCAADQSVWIDDLAQKKNLPLSSSVTTKRTSSN
jgi:hypothetical protein